MKETQATRAFCILQKARCGSNRSFCRWLYLEIDSFRLKRPVHWPRIPQSRWSVITSRSAVEAVSEAYQCDVGHSVDGETSSLSEFFEMRISQTGKIAPVEFGRRWHCCAPLQMRSARPRVGTAIISARKSPFRLCSGDNVGQRPPVLWCCTQLHGSPNPQ